LEAAQLLYTSDDLDARDRFLNTRRTLLELLERGIVPIVNENDTVSFDEIKLGDNDRLSALTAGLIDADLLLILSSVAGLYERGSKDRVVPVVRDAAEALAHVQMGTSSVGTGGMGTKIAAASTCAGWGIPTIIASGGTPDILRRVVAGEELGTLFAADASRARSRRARDRWLQASARPKGTIVVDDGAARALSKGTASLLPTGVVGVRGEFTRGQAVQIAPRKGEPFARGICAYSSSEIDLIKGKKASQIPGVLGYTICDEVVHRNDLVLL
jgi:glutamate 5-kinase